MTDAFIAILSPVLTLFICLAIGFLLKKVNILPENSATTLAKLETYVFAPSLTFMSMATAFTPSSIAEHSTNLLFAVAVVAVALAIGIALSYLFVPKKCYERGVYQYALVIANLGYMADPLVQALFGDAVLGAYKFFCIPFTIIIYTWGISVLTPASHSSGSPLKRLLNFPTLSLLLGIVAGLIGALGFLPEVIISTLNSLKVCMGPLAMILAGVTIARYDVKKLLINKKVYLATLLRLIILPVLLITVVAGAREILNTVFALEISAAPVYFTFFATAMPLGMNTVVFPEAYGGNPEPGASMALISSTLSVVTIPILYMILTTIIPCPF